MLHLFQYDFQVNIECIIQITSRRPVPRGPLGKYCVGQKCNHCGWSPHFYSVFMLPFSLELIHHFISLLVELSLKWNENEVSHALHNVSSVIFESTIWFKWSAVGIWSSLLHVFNQFSSKFAQQTKPVDRRCAKSSYVLSSNAQAVQEMGRRGTPGLWWRPVRHAGCAGVRSWRLGRVSAERWLNRSVVPE